MPLDVSELPRHISHYVLQSSPCLVFARKTTQNGHLNRKPDLVSRRQPACDFNHRLFSAVLTCGQDEDDGRGVVAVLADLCQGGGPRLSKARAQAGHHILLDGRHQALWPHQLQQTQLLHWAYATCTLHTCSFSVAQPGTAWVCGDRGV